MLAGVILAHAVALVLILNIPMETQPIIPAAPLYVRLIEPTDTPPEPTPAPPKPIASTAKARAGAAAHTSSQAGRPSAGPGDGNPAGRPDRGPRVEPVRGEPQPSRSDTGPDRSAQARATPAGASQPRFNADYLDNPKPPYPSVSRRMGEEGEVQLRVSVDAAGNAQQIEIQRSSGFPRLDQAALETVKRWRFVPARQGNQPVSSWVIVPIQFSLRS